MLLRVRNDCSLSQLGSFSLSHLCRLFMLFILLPPTPTPPPISSNNSFCPGKWPRPSHTHLYSLTSQSRPAALPSRTITHICECQSAPGNSTFTCEKHLCVGEPVSVLYNLEGDSLASRVWEVWADLVLAAAQQLCDRWPALGKDLGAQLRSTEVWRRSKVFACCSFHHYIVYRHTLTCSWGITDVHTQPEDTE